MTVKEIDVKDATVEDVMRDFGLSREAARDWLAEMRGEFEPDIILVPTEPISEAALVTTSPRDHIGAVVKVVRPEEDSVEALMHDYGITRSRAEYWLAIMRGAPFDVVVVEDAASAACFDAPGDDACVSDVDDQPPALDDASAPDVTS